MGTFPSHSTDRSPGTDSCVPLFSDDFLDGVPQIAAFLGWDRRRIYYLEAKRELKSFFRVGRRICARKSTLLREVEQRERASGMVY
jgi:hypothetical protein